MALESRTQLRRMSTKRRAALAAQGITHPSSTLVAKAMKRKRSASTGPDKATVNAVRKRDGYQCVRCGGACHGRRGVDWSIQHRRARGSGGTRRPDANEPQTLILLCGSATTGCHGYVESHRDEALANGWAVRLNDDPLTKPVQHWVHGWVYLTADGRWTTRRPDPTRAPRSR